MEVVNLTGFTVLCNVCFRPTDEIDTKQKIMCLIELKSLAFKKWKCGLSKRCNCNIHTDLNEYNFSFGGNVRLLCSK